MNRKRKEAFFYQPPQRAVDKIPFKRYQNVHFSPFLSEQDSFPHIIAHYEKLSKKRPIFTTFDSSSLVSVVGG